MRPAPYGSAIVRTRRGYGAHGRLYRTTHDAAGPCWRISHGPRARIWPGRGPSGTFAYRCPREPSRADTLEKPGQSAPATSPSNVAVAGAFVRPSADCRPPGTRVSGETWPQAPTAAAGWTGRP